MPILPLYSTQYNCFCCDPYKTEKAGHGRALPLERAPAPGAARGESGSAQQHAAAAGGIEGHGEQSRQDLSAHRDQMYNMCPYSLYTAHNVTVFVVIL